MTTPRDAIGLIDGWSCDERNRSADSCRNPHGCHCREITALQAENVMLRQAAKGQLLVVNTAVAERKAAESRATRAEQERDEAYERAAGVAKNRAVKLRAKAKSLGRPHSQYYFAQAIEASVIEAAIRRLASDPR